MWVKACSREVSVATQCDSSVLFVPVIGTLALDEKFGPQRTLRTVAIVDGVIALRFG